MGSAVSCSAVQQSDVKIKREWIVDFGLLLIHKEETGKLLKMFQKLNDGEEFLGYTKALLEAGVDQTLFTSKVFVEHCDKIGNMNFYQFVTAVWNFCALNFEMLARYVFDLYDFEKKRFINLERIHVLLTDLYDQKTNSHQITERIMRELRESHPAAKPIDLYEFIKISQTHYELLLPAYIVQTQMRRTMLGLKFWNHAMKQRAVISGNKYLPVSEYLLQVRKMSKAAHAQFRMKTQESSNSMVSADFSDQLLPRKTKGSADGNSYSERTSTSGTTADSRSLVKSSVVAREGDVPPSSSDITSTARMAAKVSRKAEASRGITLDLSAASLRNRRLHIEG